MIDRHHLGHIKLTRKEFLVAVSGTLLTVFIGGDLYDHIKSHAATPTIYSEAEDGTLSAGATTITDGAASGGAAIKFASGGGGPATGQTINLAASSGDATSIIAQALAQAVTAHKSSGQIIKVLAAANSMYKVSPQKTFQVVNPSGNRGTHGVCVMLPPGVILDMNGSTLQLQGSGEAALVSNTNLTTSGTRDTNFGLMNAVLDGRNINFTSASLLQIAYADHFSLTNVKIINGTYQGGWIFASTNATLDGLQADGFAGQPWTLGSPLTTASGRNQLYDSTIGSLSSTNIKAQNGNSQPGNSFDMVMTNCTIDSIRATNCDGGIKVQWPSNGITINTVYTDRCGGSGGNCGLKLQGDATSGAVTGVKVNNVTATNQTSYGLYMQYSVNCSVQTYVGDSNNISGNASDVWVGGTNDVLDSVTSTNSGGNGLYIRPNATGYKISTIKVVNPGGKSTTSGYRAAVSIGGGSGTIGSVTASDTRSPHIMSYGVDITTSAAKGVLGSYTVTGETGSAIHNDSSAYTV